MALARPEQGEMILAFEPQKSANAFDDCLHAVATEAVFDLFEDVATSHNATVAVANSQRRAALSECHSGSRRGSAALPPLDRWRKPIDSST
jgi:hypothetical protein